jgi:hypothetical protein
MLEALIGKSAWAAVEAEVRQPDIIRFHEAIGMPPPTVAEDGSMTAPSSSRRRSAPARRFARRPASTRWWRRRGREGPMLLVTTATEYRNSEGQLKRVERWTIVHR